MLLPMLFLLKDSYYMEEIWQCLHTTIYIVTVKMGYRIWKKILYTC